MEKEIIYQAREAVGLNEYHLNGPDKRREVFYGNLDLVGNISTNEGIISNTNLEKPIISTFGLGPCIALAGYDKKSKTGFLSHNIPIKKLEDLNDPIFEKINILGINKEEMEFYIIGGNIEFENHLKEIKNYLNRKIENPIIVYEDTIEKNDPKKMGKSFALDTRNQKVYCLNGVMIPQKAKNIFTGNLKKYLSEL